MLKKQHIKKFAVVCFVFILLITSITFVTGAEGFRGLFSVDSEEENTRALGLLGDVNSDSDVNVKDATAIQKYLVDLQTLDETALVLSDVDKNENVDIRDATLIQKWIAGLVNDSDINTVIYREEENTTIPESESTTSVWSTNTTEEPVPDTQPTTEVEETQPATDPACNLQFSKYGRYTGAYVEDGTDDYVTNVAILMVTNISEKYLEYAVVTFDISGTPAAFTVTGLAPGETAWVLEQNKLQIEKDAVFTYMDDITSFTDDNSEASKNVKVTLGDGQLSVENKTDNNLKNVYVYFKLRHSDGNFLGGITYRVPMGDLDKGETASAVAIHCNGATCEVVRIDWEG